MKSIVLFLLIIISFVSYSQITLTSTNSTPNVGDVFNLKYGSSNNPSYPHLEVTGSNHTWDASMVHFRDSLPFVYTDSNNQAIQGHQNFPNANFIFYDRTYPIEEHYFQFNSQGVYFHGSFFLPYNAPPSNTPDTTVYTNSQKILEFPFTYNNQYVDSFKYVINSFAMRTGEITSVADGYGTLIMPNKIYNDVLRIKSVVNYSEVYNDPSYMDTVFYTDTIYRWYNTTNKEYILRYVESYFYNTSSGPSSTRRTSSIGARIFSGNTSSINEIYSSINPSFYPNPLSGVKTMNLSNMSDIDYINITNISGQLIRRIKYSDQKSINLSNLMSGIYLVEFVSDKSNRVTQKLVIE